MDGDRRSYGRSLKPDKTAKIRAGVEYRVPVSPTITEWILLPDLRERLAHQLNSLVGPCHLELETNEAAGRVR